MRPVVIAAISIVVVLFSFQNCSNHLETPNTPVIDYSSVQSIQPDCDFNSTGLMNGNSVQAYRASTVPIGQQCQGEVRTCMNGHLTGTYEYAFCLPGAPAACLIDGRTIPSGSNIKVFKTATVGYGLKCEDTSEVRSCKNGVLSGSFTFASCIEERPRDCNLNGDIILNGGPGKRYYREASVPYLGNCVAELRVCTNGVLSGSYTVKECRAQAPVGCNVNGTAMTNGQTMNFFNTASVPYNQTCPPSVPRTCGNGAVDGDANYRFLRCDPLAATGCSLDGQPVAHNASIDAFKLPVVPYGESCRSPSNLESRRCTNGTLGGSFPYAACREGDPSQSCVTLDGTVIPHGPAGTLFKSNLVAATAVSCTAGSNADSAFCDNGTLKLGSATGAVLTGGRYKNCEVGKKHETQFQGAQLNGYFPNVSCGGTPATGMFFAANNEVEDIDAFGLFCPYQVQRGTNLSNPYEARCPSGKYVVGVYGQSQNYSLSGGWFSMGQVMCANGDGSGLEMLSRQYGWFHAGEYPTWYQVCQPGYVVTSLTMYVGGTVNSFKMECTQIAIGVNQDCQGDWIDQGCLETPNYPMNYEKYYIRRHKGGNGAACPVANFQVRAGTRDCTPPDPCAGGGCGGGGGPGDGGGTGGE